jgi:hypothetical protein
VQSSRPSGSVPYLVVLTWSLTGLCGILVAAIVRLTPKASEALQSDLDATHWVFAVLWTLFMLYTEAWRGFHKKFAPRAVSRGLHLAKNGTLLQALLGPLFCMALFHSTRRRVIASWVLTFFIVLMVLSIRLLEQPWRGLVDLGVVLGLAGGVLAVAVDLLRIHRGGAPVDPELPA